MSDRRKSRPPAGPPIRRRYPCACVRPTPSRYFLPRAENGAPTALDFAVTSGLRQDWIRTVADYPNHVFEEYEAFKRSFQDTDSACRSVGLRFLPMILEAHAGSWSPAARKVWSWLGQNQRAAWSDRHEPSSLKIAQRLSCSLHRENARAFLRREAVRSAKPYADVWALDLEWQ